MEDTDFLLRTEGGKECSGSKLLGFKMAEKNKTLKLGRFFYNDLDSSGRPVVVVGYRHRMGGGKYLS